jgi:DNA-binding transcriptional MerR regulator
MNLTEAIKNASIQQVADIITRLKQEGFTIEEIKEMIGGVNNGK